MTSNFKLIRYHFLQPFKFKKHNTKYTKYIRYFYKVHKTDSTTQMHLINV